MSRIKFQDFLRGARCQQLVESPQRSSFETLKICTAYNYKGEIIKHFPYNIEAENVSPIYTEFKGWSEDITGISSEAEFPKELSEYIAFVEKETGIRISIVSVGPDRKQTIVR